MNTVLFYYPNMEPLAKKIYEASYRNIKLGKISWDKFEGGWQNYHIHNAAQDVRRRDVVLLASAESPADVPNILAVADAFPRYLANSLKVILPLFPGETMERVKRYGDIATAKTYARMFSNMPMAGRPVELIVYDLHVSAERFYFSDQIIPDPQTAISLLKNEIKDMKNVAIAFPDEGSLKRFEEDFKEYPLIICYKRRRGADRKVTIVEGDPWGKNVIVVDDLSLTAGTIVACGEAMRKGEAESVSGFVPHGVFYNESWKKITPFLFDNFWITDSYPTAFSLEGIAPFKILSLAPDLIRVLHS